jgi:hypothetical protein
MTKKKQEKKNGLICLKTGQIIKNHQKFVLKLFIKKKIVKLLFIFKSKLQERVFKGIPNSIRSRAWYKLLDIDNQKRMQAGVYEKMKNSGRQYSLDLRQIDLDINRTFRDNIAYKTRYCQRQVQLYNVLAAYSIYNTEIGYCQGMSGITALLLMYLSDEEVRWRN